VGNGSGTEVSSLTADYQRSRGCGTEDASESAEHLAGTVDAAQGAGRITKSDRPTESATQTNQTVRNLRQGVSSGRMRIGRPEGLGVSLGR